MILSDDVLLDFTGVSYTDTFLVLIVIVHIVIVTVLLSLTDFLELTGVLGHSNG
jgi:hypothetical protein